MRGIWGGTGGPKQGPVAAENEFAAEIGLVCWLRPTGSPSKM
jgi:hypothetical protein